MRRHSERPDVASLSAGDHVAIGVYVTGNNPVVECRSMRMMKLPAKTHGKLIAERSNQMIVDPPSITARSSAVAVMFTVRESDFPHVKPICVEFPRKNQRIETVDLSRVGGRVPRPSVVIEDSVRQRMVFRKIVRCFAQKSTVVIGVLETIEYSRHPTTREHPFFVGMPFDHHPVCDQWTTVADVSVRVEVFS